MCPAPFTVPLGRSKGRAGELLPTSLRSSVAAVSVELVDATIPVINIDVVESVVTSVSPWVINVGTKPKLLARVQHGAWL